MDKLNLEEIAEALADGIREGLCSNQPGFFSQLLVLLAGGKPVSLKQIANALHISRDEVNAILRQMPSVELDNDGNIVGSGLTLKPTPHHFQVGGHELFTWCALDTLFFPAILKQPAQVESSCPISGAKVLFTVSPERLEGLEPPGAVVSIVIPEASDACCDVRGAFCNDVHFFSSSEVASKWVSEHPGAIILSVEEAYHLGLILVKNLFKESSDLKEEGMNQCCPIKHDGIPPVCPMNDQAVKPVGRITVESLVQSEIKSELLSQPYYFCNAPDCDTVYVSALGDHLITKDQLTVRVGIKEQDDPKPICYCFNFVRQDIQEDIRKNGSTEIPKIIAARIKGGECQCEVKNPSGTCCLGNVYREVKQAQAMSKQGLGL